MRLSILNWGIIVVTIGLAVLNAYYFYKLLSYETDADEIPRWPYITI